MKEYQNSAAHETCEIIEHRINSFNVIPATHPQAVSSYLDKVCNDKAIQNCKSGEQTMHCTQN